MILFFSKWEKHPCVPSDLCEDKGVVVKSHRGGGDSLIYSEGPVVNIFFVKTFLLSKFDWLRHHSALSGRYYLLFFVYFLFSDLC